MKKIFFAVILLLVGSAFAFAQKPVAGDNQLTGVFSTSVPNLLLRHYTKDNFALRYGLAFNYSHASTITAYPGYTLTNKNSTQTFALSFGIQKSIKMLNDKIEPYYGVDVVLSEQYSVLSSKNVTTDTAIYGGYNGDYTYSKTKNPLALTAALRPVLGINYYFNSNIGIGLEYRINSLFSYTHSFSGSYNSTDYDDHISTTQHTTNLSTSSFSTGLGSSLYVTVSYKFNKKGN